MDIKNIVWGEAKSPNNKCSYDHCVGKSPLGKWLITWKSWKEQKSFDIDESPFGYVGGYGDTLEEAQQIAQKEFEQKILNCIKDT